MRAARWDGPPAIGGVRIPGRWHGPGVNVSRADKEKPAVVGCGEAALTSPYLDPAARHVPGAKAAGLGSEAH